MPLVVADGTGGAFVAWQENRSGNADVYVQRLTASGEIAPGWPVDGIPACGDPHPQRLGFFSPGLTDGAGGLIIPWIDYRDFVSGGTLEDIYAQRVLPDGSIASGWPVDGAPVRRAPSRDDAPVLIADGGGGAFFSWYDHTDFDIYLQRLTASGGVAPGWPTDGLPVCTLPSLQRVPLLAPDGGGGLLVAWGDHRDGPPAVYAQRVTGSGQIASGWPGNGIRIVLDRAIAGLVSDDAGGAYLSCATFGPVNDDDYYLQRFTGSGTIASGWPEGGVVVCQAPDERNAIRMVADGAGGALLVWADYRDGIDDDIFALRMRSDGTREPGWPADGLRVTDDTALDDFPDLVPDGTGGAYLTWVRYTTALGDRVRVQHLMGNGAVAPGWPAGGREIPTEVPSEDARIAADGMGGAIVAWRRWDGTVRALRFGPDGPVAAVVSLVNAEVEPGLVRLTWHAPDGAPLLATVERRTESSEWQPLATVTPDGTGTLRYEDRSVTEGVRYGYRLAYADGGAISHTTESWVTVPALRFALHSLAPNPSAGTPAVKFSVASDAPVRLELFDVHGRQVVTHEAGSVGPGSHTIRLSTPVRLAAGVYTVLLRQGLQTASARAVILR